MNANHERSSVLVGLLQTTTTMAGIALALIVFQVQRTTAPFARVSVFLSGSLAIYASMRGIAELVDLKRDDKDSIRWRQRWTNIIFKSGVESAICLCIILIAVAYVLTQFPEIGEFISRALNMTAAMFRADGIVPSPTPAPTIPPQ